MNWTSIFITYPTCKRRGLDGTKSNSDSTIFKMKEDIKYFKQIMIGKSKFDRYSQEAMHKIKEELPKIDIDELWEKHGHKRGDKSAT